MSDVFISYARSTADQAERIADTLTAEGYVVWRDDQIPAGRAFADVIQERLAEAKAVLVIWSADAARSEWVRSEAERARGDRKLVQLTVDGAVLPMPFDQIQCADLQSWTGQTDWAGWRQVTGAIAALTGRTPQPAAPARSRRGTGIGVCVLPFANMSGDPEQEYFSDGISEDIITDLSKVSALSVISRNSAFQFKGRHVDLRQIARQLEVAYVLEGSVRKAGSRVRITAQLIAADSDSHIWADRYDRDLTDIFALQDEISQAIVAALKLKLLPHEKEAIEKRGTSNADAYNHYLMARQYAVSGNSDIRGLQATIRLCQAAVDLDPGYAQAWAQMAIAQATLFYRQGIGEPGMEAADRALSLDPDLAEAHAIKGRLWSAIDRYEEAEAESAIALALDPQSFEANFHAGYLAFRRQRLPEAIRYYEAASALVGTAFNAPTMLIGCYAAIGDHEGMKRAARMTLTRAEKAIAVDQSNGYAMAAAASALAVLDEAERARNWIARAMLIDPENRAMQYNLICTLSQGLEDVDGAIELARSYFAGASLSELVHTRIDPDLDILRSDPRYQAMEKEAEARLAGERP